MIFQQSLFQSRQARQSFWILFIGILLLMSASVSVFSSYRAYTAYNVSVDRLAYQIVRVVVLAKALPIKELPHMVRALNGEGVRVKIEPQPRPNAQVIQSPDPHALRQLVEANPQHLNLTLQLADGQWLNIHAHRMPHGWLLVGAIISSFVLLLALIFLCIGVIRRLDVPLSPFLQAAKRFGIDVDAPPLALRGGTEMQEVITAFNEMQDRIRRLLHDRTQMLAAISHDLRTPITRLQLRAEYLQGTDQYEKAVADLKEMENMISSILSFARDHVRSENMERFDLNALLETICDDMIDIGHSVTYHSDMQRTPYFGRIVGLKRAITNLIENAVKYGQQAEVSLKQTETELQIRVSDQGPGIPSDQLEKVFAPFYRVDTARSLKQSGTGLGLAVAQDIIRAHGGEIRLYNRDPHGLTAVISLPRQDLSL